MTAGVCQRCGEAAPEITPELIAFGRTEYGNDFFPLCNPCTARELRANGWDRQRFARFAPELLPLIEDPT